MATSKDRHALVDRCKALIAEAYQEATEMIVAWLETHDDKRQPLCKEIGGDSWKALEHRVIRLQEKRRSERISGIPDPRIGRTAGQKIGDAKRALRDPDLTAELLDDPEVRSAIRKQLNDRDSDAARDRSRGRRHDPVTAKIDGHRAVQVLSGLLDSHATSVTEVLNETGPLAENDLRWVTGSLERSEAANTEVRFYLEHGETRVDAELRALSGDR